MQVVYLGDDPKKNTWVMRKGHWTGGEPTKRGSGVLGRAFVDHAPEHLPQNQTSRGVYPPTALPRWLRLKIRPLAPWCFLCPGGQRMASGGGSHSDPSARQWPNPQPSLAALSTLMTPSCLGLPRAPLAGVKRELRGTRQPLADPQCPKPQTPPPRHASPSPHAWRSWGQIMQCLSLGSHQAAPRHLSSHGTSRPHGVQGRNPQALFPPPRSPFPFPGSVLLPNSLSPNSALSSQHILPSDLHVFPLSVSSHRDHKFQESIAFCLLTHCPTSGTWDDAGHEVSNHEVFKGLPWQSPG